MVLFTRTCARGRLESKSKNKQKQEESNVMPYIDGTPVGDLGRASISHTMYI